MRHEFASVGVIPVGFWKWKYMSPEEWRCKGDGTLVVETEFLDRFEKLRQMFGQPLTVSSGYRSPAYNLEVATSGEKGPHTYARAVDVLIAGRDALDLIVIASGIGFTGHGFKQHGDIAQRFAHLDDLPHAPGRPRPWLWTY